MYENLISLFIILSITFTAKDKYAVGVLVACYYGVYISFDLDFFGMSENFVYVTHDKAVKWYIISIGMSFIFFLLSLLVYMFKGSKTALIYSVWCVFGVFIHGVGASFQIAKDNSFLNVYNIIQIINLFVDIIVVIIGTDNMIRNTSNVSRFINYIDIFISRLRTGNGVDRNGVNPCQPKN